ncbi:MAG: helix-turn-helix transcriptional regulator [Gordonibacter sp.]|uniref:helix-turn-helix transcriptional regulator n=1 Tax=Gordonibacter sp. TaxID=1968902 RepID=UPI002FCBD686
MSFRDNMRHLRATRNMTQEQLAMLLGVSRQSVSKWEAERAYPEMDKLIRMCALFECTLDELVMGDLTDLPANKAASMPSGKALQDVTGYDQAMRASAWKLSLGVALALVGAAWALLLSSPALVPVDEVRNSASVLVFIGIAVGLGFVLPAALARRAFRRAHPFVDDFYTDEQKDQARAIMSKSLVIGLGLFMVGAAAAVMLQADAWLAGGAFFMLAAGGVFVVVRGCLLGSRCNLKTYNDKSLLVMSEDQVDALDDEALRARARKMRRENSIYGIVLGLSTVVGLMLLFIPALGAQRWFWLAWVIGGILCGVIGGIRSVRGDE